MGPPMAAELLVLSVCWHSKPYFTKLSVHGSVAEACSSSDDSAVHYIHVIIIIIIIRFV